jgi:ethanolamine utilization protein EutA
MSAGFSVPRIEIIGKEIAYRSDVHFTPLKSPTEIDMAGVREIIRQEYEKSGLNKADIKTGAVIITGETARKHNANEVLRSLSDFAGDFVVATAGPDLESIIAARGAGADIYSKEHSCEAANYDIGGGTSNLGAFLRGEVSATGCLDIGGRLIKLNPVTHKVSYVSPKIAELCEGLGLNVAVGAEAKRETLEKVCAAMCGLLEMSLGLRPKSAFYPRILTEPGKDIKPLSPNCALSFSGGVADYVYNERPGDDVFRFGDIGILLGRAVRASELLAKLPRFEPRETIRATVVGAGSHITEISGSTIEYDPALLPRKNIPILKLAPDEEQGAEGITKAIREKLEWFRVEGELQPVAVAFEGPQSPKFSEVQELCGALMKGLEPILAAGHPFISVSERDIAKVLGQTVRANMPGGANFICIDAVTVSGGDYIDIGAPAAEGAVLPVVVKTILFK